MNPVVEVLDWIGASFGHYVITITLILAIKGGFCHRDDRKDK